MSIEVIDQRPVVEITYQQQVVEVYIGGIKSSASAGVPREVEINVGSTFVPMHTYIHADATVTANSIVNAFLLGKRTSDNRDPDEAFVEDIQVFAIPGAGQITFYLKPAFRLFHGRFLIGYTVS